MTGTEPLDRRLALVAITDPVCGPGREIADVVRMALQGGAGCVQLRAKDQATREVVSLGQRLREETARAGALLFVNDRVDVALVIGADGAHLGDDDLPVPAARRITPTGFLLGRSVGTVREALSAQRDGADYLGVGPVFGTPSKSDAGPEIGLAGLRAVHSVAAIPIVAIGGIDATNAEQVAGAGAAGVAVIRAVMQADDPAGAASELIEAVRRGRRGSTGGE